MKRYIIKGILICAGIFICILCFKSIKGRNTYFENKEEYQVLYGIEDMDYQDMELVREEQEYISGCYSVKENQQITGILNRESEVTVVYKDFDSELLFQSFNTLSREDKSGCLLDEETMYALFGTAVGVGQTVTFDEEEYIVRGVIKDDIPVMVINYKEEDKKGKTESDTEDNAENNTKMGVDGILIDASEELYKNQYRGKIENICSISEGYYFSDYKSITSWIETPTKWSDFNFWGKYFDTIGNRIQHMFLENKDIPEQLAIRTCAHNIRYYLVIFIILIWLVVVLWRVIKKEITVIRRKNREDAKKDIEKKTQHVLQQ